MSYKNYFYPESEFGGFSDIDGTVSFYTRVNALLGDSFTVLDVGYDTGIYREDAVLFRRNLRILRGKGKKVIGIDVDSTAAENPCIDEFRLIEGNAWPVENDSVDLARYAITFWSTSKSRKLSLRKHPG